MSRVGDAYGGAIGSLNNNQGSIKLTNAFCETYIQNGTPHHSNQSSFSCYAIIGLAGYEKDNTTPFTFSNLYGCVKTASTINISESRKLELYSLQARLQESNCVGCTSLPSSHKLSVAIWDLSDLSAPLLK